MRLGLLLESDVSSVRLFLLWKQRQLKRYRLKNFAHSLDNSGSTETGNYRNGTPVTRIKRRVTLLIEVFEVIDFDNDHARLQLFAELFELKYVALRDRTAQI